MDQFHSFADAREYYQSWSAKQTNDMTTMVLSTKDYEDAIEELGYFWMSNVDTTIMPFVWLRMVYGV